MSDSSSERDPVEALAEEFLDRQRRGERPDVTEYARRYPQWADFQAARDKLDPDRTFANPYLERVLG